MTVQAKVPTACTFSTRGPRDFTVDEIRSARRSWARFDGFTGETCGDCGARANVLVGSAGWHCACGHFNMQSHSSHQTPHDLPDYGPRRLMIVAGLADDEDDAPDEGGGCGCK